MIFDNFSVLTIDYLYFPLTGTYHTGLVMVVRCCANCKNDWFEI